MGIKVSIGVSETEEEREQLEALRAKAPSIVAGSAPDAIDRPRPHGWSLRADLDDEYEGAQPLWAW